MMGKEDVLLGKAKKTLDISNHLSSKQLTTSVGKSIMNLQKMATIAIALVLMIQLSTFGATPGDVWSITTGSGVSDEVGKWRRYVVTLDNNTYSGNPFELEVDATFTHTATSTQLTLPGYYDGSDQWKIAFMPTKLGQWTYTTSSSERMSLS